LPKPTMFDRRPLPRSRVILLTDRQTDRQTDRHTHTEQSHYFASLAEY